MVEMGSFTKFIKSYQKSEIIFEESSMGDEMYVIHSGKVRLSTRAPGQEVELATLGPGEFFGEMSLVYVKWFLKGVLYRAQIMRAEFRFHYSLFRLSAGSRCHFHMNWSK